MSARSLALALALLVLGWSGAADAAKRRGGKRHLRRLKARAAAVVTRAAAPTEVAAAPVAVAAPAPAPAAPTSGSRLGRVQMVTDRRAYLDRGAVDGLVAGQALAIARAGRPIGSCTLEVVGDHEATCTGHRLRVGDMFRTAHGAGRRQAGRRRDQAAVDAALDGALLVLVPDLHAVEHR